MTNFQRLATVRTRFLKWLQDADQHSVEQGTDGSLIHRESMLIRDEFFCGRKFHARHHTAVWFIEEDVLKIYGADDSLELVLRGAEIDVCETAESAVESGERASAADWQRAEQADAEQADAEVADAEVAIAEHAREHAREHTHEDAHEDASEPLEVEPRILKLATAYEDGEDSLDSSAHVSDKRQTNDQQTGEMDSGEQESRKAA